MYILNILPPPDTMLMLSSTYITLSEEINPATIFACLVRWFLSMALADDVFVEQKVPSDFDNRWIRETANSREFLIREDKKELPVLRLLHGNKISNKILTYGSLRLYLRQLGERCGYEKPVRCYDFRRGFGNAVEGLYPR